MAHGSGGDLPRQDLGQRRHVDLVEHGPAAGALQPRDELGAEDVDLAVQDPPLVAELLLLLLELGLQLLQLLVGE